ncbi:MAG: hypothetical protein LBI59_02690, partial [Candidatus Accumulibacter sp.]|nr:hypothetical protein [Accumulibacter sp.]
ARLVGGASGERSAGRRESGKGSWSSGDAAGIFLYFPFLQAIRSDATHVWMAESGPGERSFEAGIARRLLQNHTTTAIGTRSMIQESASHHPSPTKAKTSPTMLENPVKSGQRKMRQSDWRLCGCLLMAPP